MSEENKTEQPAQGPRNYLAILEWCSKFRPDLVPVIEAEKNNNGFILLMTIGFEAGRVFQKENPDYPFVNERVAPIYAQVQDTLEVTNGPTTPPSQ